LQRAALEERNPGVKVGSVTEEVAMVPGFVGAVTDAVGHATEGTIDGSLGSIGEGDV